MAETDGAPTMLPEPPSAHSSSSVHDQMQRHKNWLGALRPVNDIKDKFLTYKIGLNEIDIKISVVVGGHESCVDGAKNGEALEVIALPNSDKELIVEIELLGEEITNRFSQVHGLGIYTVGFLEPVAGVHGFSIEIYLQRKFNHSLDMLPLLPGK